LDPGWGLYSVAALPGGQLLTLRSDGSTTGIAERLDPATGSFTVVAGFALGFAPGPLWPGRGGFYYAGAVSLQFGGPMLLQIDPNGGGSIPFGGFISGIVGPFDGIFYVTDASGLCRFNLLTGEKTTLYPLNSGSSLLTALAELPDGRIQL